jgi:hypothetical protein
VSFSELTDKLHKIALQSYWGTNMIVMEKMDLMMKVICFFFL